MSTGRGTGVALVLCFGLVATAHGTTITVNSTDDSLAVDGNCTLREAIIAANTDTAVDACPAGSGADVVVVSAGTYTLTLVGAGEDASATGDLDVTADLEIDGAGAAATVIDGNSTDRVLDIDPAGAGLTVLVSGVTLQHGSSVDEGGAVRSRATLTMADSVVQASRTNGGILARGGGIASDGSLRVERCSIHDNTASVLGSRCTASGGGIDASGALDVVDSTIADNTANAGFSVCVAIGAGINAGDLTMAGSTVSGNLATFGGMESASLGGGLGITNATIRNSTVSGNSGFFGGGLAAGSGGTVTLLNTTVAGNNGDGIEIISTGVALVLRNTIVSATFPASACSNELFGDPFTTVGDDYNIDSDNTCGLSGTDIPGVDPLLAPLADNGGPTLTRALFAGSPAIDAGNPAAPGSGGLACEANDQRGVARPVGARCDIGAFEGSVTTTSTTSTTTTTLCPAAPSAGCQPALGGKAKLTLKGSADTAKQRLSWKWVSSAAVPEADFENPVTGGNGYMLCVYDQMGRRLDAAAPAGGMCGRKPCWKQTSSGFVYDDPLLDPDGLQKVVLKAGTAAGRARITVTGKGANLRLSTLPLTIPVRVQLTRDLTTTCWEATFSTSSRNTAESFTASSDP